MASDINNLCNEGSIKTQRIVSESFWVGEHMQTQGAWCPGRGAGSSEYPHMPPAIWLLQTYTLYNKLAI